MRHLAPLRWLALPISLALVACSGGGGAGDTPLDAAGDASTDARSETRDASSPSDANPSRPSDAGPGADTGVDDSGDAGTADADDAAPPDANGPDAPDAPDAGDGDAGVGEGGTVPTSCMDLSGEYLGNVDHFVLTRPGCGSLSWVEEGFGSSPGWTHVYTTDGVPRSVTDEKGNPIVEEAHVDDVAMYVHRTNSSGLDIHQKDYWSTQPCNLLSSEAVYLTRETTGTQTNCELWQLMDHCPGGTRECDANPQTVCEVHTPDDPKNCGGCNVVCGTANSTGGCSRSRCELACNPGFSDCNQRNADGCEANLEGDLNNCGACGSVCAPWGTSAVACNQGVCALTCADGRADCDGNPSNGCEVATAGDSGHCGSCGNDCVGALCAAGQCQGKGTTLTTVTSTTMTATDLQVDDAYLYYEMIDPITGAASLSAIDKVKGGAPIVVAASILTYASAGDGTVYYVTGPAFGQGTQSLVRWTRATGQTQTVATAPADVGSFNLVGADASGIVWNADQLAGQTWTTQTLAWSPGDGAPRTLRTVTSSSLVLALGINSTYAFYWLDDGTSETLTGVPRAGGAPVSFASLPDSAGRGTMIADDSYVYVWTTAALDRVPLVPAGGAPDGGASFSAWFSEPVGVGPLRQSGADLFIGPGNNTSQVVQVTKTDPPVMKAVAAAAAYASSDPFAVDESAVYLFDYWTRQIRRVPR